MDVLKINDDDDDDDDGGLGHFVPRVNSRLSFVLQGLPHIRGLGNFVMMKLLFLLISCGGFTDSEGNPPEDTWN